MSDIKIFENKKVRSQYDADKEVWYFSIVGPKLLESIEKQAKKGGE
jgi:hypothetical protein